MKLLRVQSLFGPKHRSRYVSCMGLPSISQNRGDTGALLETIRRQCIPQRKHAPVHELVVSAVPRAVCTVGAAFYKSVQVSVQVQSVHVCTTLYRSVQVCTVPVSVSVLHCTPVLSILRMHSRTLQPLGCLCSSYS